MTRMVCAMAIALTCDACGELLLSVVSVGSAAAQPAAAPPNENPHQQLEQVMRDPMFQRWQLRQQRAQSGEAGSEMSWLQSIGVLFGDWLDRWLDSRDTPSPKPQSSSDVQGVLMTTLKFLGVICAAVLLVFFVYAVVNLLREAERRPAKHILSRQQVREALETGEALAMGSEQWLQEADRLVAERDMRIAFRALYLSLLSGLHSARCIDFRRNRTNWVYVDRFRGGEDDRQSFGQLTRMFDDAWYGLDTTGLPPIDNLKRQITCLLAGEEPRA